MHPTKFPGSVEIKKPASMTDEQCISVWAKHGFGKLMKILEQKEQAEKIGMDFVVPGITAGIDKDDYSYYITAWQPSYEDLKALNSGQPVYVKVLGIQLPPMALFTLDENNEGNF